MSRILAPVFWSLAARPVRRAHPRLTGASARLPHTNFQDMGMVMVMVEGTEADLMDLSTERPKVQTVQRSRLCGLPRPVYCPVLWFVRRPHKTCARPCAVANRTRPASRPLTSLLGRQLPGECGEVGQGWRLIATLGSLSHGQRRRR
ncbi:hypothetical protein B0T24DRAFT_629160 [Lasiosphaeria ovina]|uniref:Uncharacterized protein n=1 Tax=Lasiosphaeria ovina TaxID=92902 RepID=A0AAE0N5I0_9PEZI|nr:hypothetical protein B0T24DRAFT_629160 [Lasiosphaeria ovina]